MTSALELRAGLELRVTQGRRLGGLAAVFNSPARIGDSFVESIRAGAFAASLASGADILALADHDPTKLLGRTSSGTLALREDSKGLSFDLSVPDTQLGNDVLTMVERGDLGGMSLGFRVPAGGDVWTGADKRELVTVQLVEVSIVSAFPAYSGTTIAARARQLGRLEADARMRRMILEVL